ncbi:MAG: hypothetical protein MJK04_33015, partial [Psychrosphaera sp.]|nr:hypothetical protein [Psychrosphaera sp.]
QLKKTFKNFFSFGLDLFCGGAILGSVMITKQSDINLRQSQDFKSYSFGIKDSGLAHIFNVLRNQLYSDKILAVIREYSANAIDAHVEMDKASTPIKVTLPNKLNLKLKVRDFGRGLTETEIAEIYAMYGESTKRGSNAQIGQLGLGCLDKHLGVRIIKLFDMAKIFVS